MHVCCLKPFILLSTNWNYYYCCCCCYHRRDSMQILQMQICNQQMEYEILEKNRKFEHKVIAIIIEPIYSYMATKQRNMYVLICSYINTSDWIQLFEDFKSNQLQLIHVCAIMCASVRFKSLLNWLCDNYCLLVLLLLFAFFFHFPCVDVKQFMGK